MSPAVLLCALGVSLAACGPEPAGAPPKPVWPAGTVLALNGVAIAAEDVDELAQVYARLQPQFNEPHCRRLALTNVVFPRVAAQGIDAARREAALAQARAYAQSLASGDLAREALAGPAEVERSGVWKDLGLEAWSAAVDRLDDRWSEVH